MNANCDVYHSDISLHMQRGCLKDDDAPTYIRSRAVGDDAACLSRVVSD